MRKVETYSLSRVKRKEQRRRSIEKFIKTVKDIPNRIRHYKNVLLNEYDLPTKLGILSKYVITGVMITYPITVFTTYSFGMSTIIAFTFTVILYEHYLQFTVDVIRGRRR